MPKFLCLLFMILLGLSLTACFDVVEEVDMRSNGSGKIKATMNLSKSKTKVSSLMKLGKIDGIQIPSETEIRGEFNTVIRLLRQTPGISNVRHSLDMSNYVADLSCDFNDINALNAFSRTLSEHFNVNISGYSNYTYDKQNKIFARSYKYNPDAKKEFDKLSGESKKNFHDAFFTSIYRFDKEVKQASNTTARIAPNKRAVMTKTTVLDLIHDKVNLSNNITLNN